MSPRRPTRVRLGAGALAAAGVLFLLYPAVRPWEDETTAEGARQAMAAGAWVASHGFAMLGFVLVALGLLALWSAVSRTAAEPLAAAAVLAAWVGAGLTLPYYGAETFGLHAVAAAGGDVPLLEIVDGFRFDPVAVSAFGVGLLLLAAAAVLAAVATWRSGQLQRHAGVVFAAGFALFLPQFFTPPAVRIGHGVVMAVGCGWLAVALWRAPASARHAGEGAARV